MNRHESEASALRQIGACALMGGLLFAGNCMTRKAAEPAIRLLPSSEDDPDLRNGIAYDVGTLDLEEGDSIVLPASTMVIATADKSVVTLHVRKQLGWIGHPERPLGPEDARAYMGCAWRRSSGVIEFGTYGEWLGAEGGADLQVVACVPPGTKCVLSAAHHGNDSVAQDLTAFGPTPDGGFWRAASSPASGWTRIPTQPDVAAAALADEHGSPVSLCGSSLAEEW